MWIQTSNSATRRLYDAELMTEPVEFSATGTAQVPRDIGEALIEAYDTIEPMETDDD